MADFLTCLARVLQHEGGYVDHPADPGGATNKGITQRTYDGWRADNRLPPRSVRHLSDAELRAIYRERYWDRVRASELPPGIAYVVFDAAVHSGPRRAIEWLQWSVGTMVDGVLGPVTLAAVRRQVSGSVIIEYCEHRLIFLRRLPHWPTFGRGWQKRVEEVERLALIDAAEAAPRPTPPQSQGWLARNWDWFRQEWGW